MKRLLAPVLFITTAAWVLIAGTVFAEPTNSVNLGIGTGTHVMPHCNAIILLAEYEHMLGPNVSILGRTSGLHYKFDDGSYVEDGKPRGLDVGARYYFEGQGMKGFFIGGALGYWRSKWTFTEDKGIASETQGNGESRSVRANIDIGDRIQIGSSAVSIMPAVHFGKFFSNTTCDYSAPASRVGTDCSRDSEVSYYAFVAVSVGIGF